VSPWRYPDRDVQGNRLGWEADLVHAGPFVIGDDARILLSDRPTDVEVAGEYEDAPNPAETEEISNFRLPQDRHLGHPVDYTLYLVSRLAANKPIPSFNLDSDRAYAWRCWDWSRHIPSNDPATGTPWWDCRPFGTAEFDMLQPCTPPAQFDPYDVWQHQPPRPAPPLPEHRFDPQRRRLLHYLDPNADEQACGDFIRGDTIPDSQLAQAEGLPPEGEG
jgi:hypothetical protein